MLDKLSRMVYNNVTRIPEQKVGDEMRLDEVATVRTGAVIGRKRAENGTQSSIHYKMLNLKCIATDGYIDLNFAEDYYAKEELKPEYFSQNGDVLIRLSFPYTSVLIDEKTCGFVIPSHFAIIRADRKRALPEYILWFLRRDSSYQQIVQNSSGSTALGTISSGFIASLDIQVIPKDKQKAIGQLLILANKEQELLTRLAKEKAAFNKIALNSLYNKVKGDN